MSDCLCCPVCPACDGRRQKFRFDTDRHIGVVRCEDCDEDIFIVSLLANKHVTVVKDPMADILPESTYEALKANDRLPPAAERDMVDIDIDDTEASR